MTEAHIKLQLAQDVLECHVEIEDVSVSHGVVRPCIRHGQQPAPFKEDFPADIEAAIDDVLESYDYWVWRSHNEGDFRHIEHAGSSLGQGSTPRHGRWWYPVLEQSDRPV